MTTRSDVKEATKELAQFECNACTKSTSALKLCSGCGIACYCDALCQRAHWHHHKDECTRIAASVEVGKTRRTWSLKMAPRRDLVHVRLSNDRNGTFTCGDSLPMPLSMIDERIVLPLAANIPGFASTYMARMSVAGLLRRIEHTKTCLKDVDGDTSGIWGSSEIVYGFLVKMFRARETRYDAANHMANQSATLAPAMISSQLRTQNDHVSWLVFFYWLANPDSPRIIGFDRNPERGLQWLVVPVHRFS